MPRRACAQASYKCLFARRYLASRWDGVVLGTVHGSGAAAAAPWLKSWTRGRPRAGHAGMEKAGAVQAPAYQNYYHKPAELATPWL